MPNVDDPENTFFHYYSHSWESFSTGQFLSHVSPNTWNERDPISEAYLSIMKHGTEPEKKKARALGRRENWLVNVYVVNDPKNPDNNGKVKILRYGKQIHKIVMDALAGEDAEDIGEKMFSLSETGCNFKIKVERQGDFPTYTSSKFAMPSKLEGMGEDKVKEIHSTVHDLKSIFTVKSYEELQEVLNEHYYGKDRPASAEDDQPAAMDEPDPVASGSTEESAASSTEDVLEDDKVKELLEGLDS